MQRPGSTKKVTAIAAAGRERRIRLVDARDGRELTDCSIDGAGDLQALLPVPGAILVPAEFAGTTQRFRVVVAGYRPRDVVLAADAPRDQDLRLEPAE